MTITALIDKTDSFELVRDQLAAILVSETASQQALATAAARDPNLWKLRVFLERSNPWAEWQDLPDTDENPEFAAPIVNVALDNISYDMRTGNVVERQKATATYNIDCYGYGVSAGDGDGHQPGDELAAIESHRALRLVRNIMMAAEYAYLGFPRGANQIVWRRWPQSVTAFQPMSGDRAVQNVMAVRLQMQVEFNEFSPQVAGEALEIVAATVKRSPNGEVLLIAEYGEADW